MPKRLFIHDLPTILRDEVEFRARYDEDFGVDTRPDRREDDFDDDDLAEWIDDDRR